MGETLKRRDIRQQTGWFDKYCRGNGIDIGAGQDPVTPTCKAWDLMDGDAEVMTGVPDATYDWVYSSHCLEHVVDPTVALASWWRILKPGGYLIVLVPDEDLYEQGLWPPHFNTDHKTTWTIKKSSSWSPVSRNLADELAALGGRIISLNLYDQDYDYSLLQGVEARYAIPPELRQQVQDKEDISIKQLRLLGYWPIDQGCSKAQISIEGIVQKI